MRLRCSARGSRKKGKEESPAASIGPIHVPASLARAKEKKKPRKKKKGEEDGAGVTGSAALSPRDFPGAGPLKGRHQFAGKGRKDEEKGERERRGKLLS